ncbi:MAG TPA: hypothetical protein VGJ64_02325 [Gemmatimonadaceae bacterium]
MSRALEQRAVARDRFEKLCDKIERDWLGPDCARVIITRHGCNLAELANGETAAAFEQAMLEFFRAANGMTTS